MEKAMKGQRLPNTDSIEELAQFWDTHDLTDFEQFLEEVGEPAFVRGRTTSLSIDLPPREVRRVKKIARSKGVNENTVLRQWILERLHEFSASGRPPSRASQPTRKPRHG
jgi:CopG antitoxin of type II toxin-antitoxin system